MEQSKEYTDEKLAAVETLKNGFLHSSAAFLVDYRGCNCLELTRVRGKLRQNNSQLQVVKNTIAVKALEQADGFGKALEPLFKGPTAIIWTKGSDVSAPAKILTEFAKDHEKFQIKGAVVDGTVISASDVEALSKMPSKEELQAQLLGLLNAAVAQVLRVINAPGTSLVRVLEAWRAEIEKRG